MKKNHRRAVAGTVLLLAVALLAACRGGGRADARLLAVDSVVDTDSVAAWRMLQAVDSASLTREADRALYALLHQQLRYKQYLPLDTTVLNQAMGHFDATREQGKRQVARARLLKGLAHIELGEMDDGIALIKHAEELMAATTDTFMLAYTQLQLATNYQNAYSEDTVYYGTYKDAARLFRAIGRHDYECECYTSLGEVYRTRNNDSAFVYIHRALDLAAATGNKMQYYNNKSTLAGYYWVVKDYARGKREAVACVDSGAAFMRQWQLSRAVTTASLCYAHLGMTDSATHYLERIPPSSKGAAMDELQRLMCRNAIAEVNGDMAGYVRGRNRSIAISDSIVKASNQVKISVAKAKYDHAQAQLASVREHLKFVVAAIGIAVLALVLALLMAVYRKRQRRARRRIEQLQLHLALAIDEVSKNETLTAEIRDSLASMLNHEHAMLLEYFTLGSHADIFARRMKRRLSSQGFEDDLWASLYTLADSTHHKIITTLRDKGCLGEQDLRLIAMDCCGFSREVEQLLLHYTNAHSITTRRARIVKHLGIDESLHDYIERFGPQR